MPVIYALWMLPAANLLLIHYIFSWQKYKRFRINDVAETHGRHTAVPKHFCLHTFNGSFCGRRQRHA